ncbi:MAG: sulfotransferase [bacterium]
MDPNNTETKTNYPIIVMGMHRSGTSILTRMLMECGLFVGWELDGTQEALFFRRRNEKLINICGGRWDNPLPVHLILGNALLKKESVESLKKDISSFRVFSFLGPKLYWKHRNLFKINIPWGWKDPRNAFLLPVWLDIFPVARFVRIVRNGIDVAKSLVLREAKRLTNPIRRDNSLLGKLKRRTSLWGHRPWLLYLLENYQRFLEQMTPLSRYNRMRAYGCDTLEGAFELWNTYVSRETEVLAHLQDRTYFLRYEDFLEAPEENLYRLACFCGLSPQQDVISHLCKSLNRSRRYAFWEDQALRAFYQSVKSCPTMQQLGYSGL